MPPSPFAPDSLVERRGFEPPVPLARVRVIFGEEKRPEVISVVSKDVVFFHRGDQRFESPLLHQRVRPQARGESRPSSCELVGVETAAPPPSMIAEAPNPILPRGYRRCHTKARAMMLSAAVNMI